MPLKERLLTAVISACVAFTACRWLVERWDALAKAEWPAIQPAAAKKTGARAPLFFLKRAFPSSTSK